MWSNTLDSDVVKWVVNLGTELVKIVDTIGLIPSILLSIASFKIIHSLFKGADIIGFIKSISTLTMGTKVFEAETRKASFALLGETINTKLAGSALVQYAVKMGLATAADVAKMTTTQLLGLSFKALGTAIWGATKAIVAFLFTNPIGWIILAVGAIASGIAIFNAVHKTAEELSEELSDLKTELQSIESEIDSLNSELETTQERMAELLALPSLSFVEQEELEELKQTTAELERQLKLKEMLAESKEADILATSEKYIDRVWNGSNADKAYTIDNGVIKKDGFWDIGVNTKSALENAMHEYSKKNKAESARKDLLANWDDINWNNIDKETSDKLEWALNGYELKGDYYVGKASDHTVEMWKKSLEDNMSYQSDMDNIAEGINMVFADENFDDLKYGMSEEIDAFLDEIYVYQLRWRQAQGEYVKSDAISSMFDATSTKEMQAFGKTLQEIADSDLTDDEKNKQILSQLDSIDGTIGDGINKIDGKTDAYNRLHLAMTNVGVSAQDIADYFVLETGTFNSNTVEGIMNQYNVAKTALDSLKSGAISLDDLVKYDSEKNEATGRVDKIADQLKGVGPEVREQFTLIVEAVKEGTMDYDAAIKKLELQGMRSVVNLMREELEEANKLAFPDLEISGWIDSVEELSSAFESLASAMDLIVTAQEQMDSSGRISMKTALDLMAATDDWNQILKVNNGVITMNANAEQILIQSKLNLIKANIEMALQQVETDIALMEGAINSTKAGNAFTQGFTKALMNAQGVLVGLKAGWDAFWAGEDVSTAFNNAYSKTVDNLTPDESSLGELYAQREKLQKQREMMDGIDTTQEFKDNYDFDKTPGDKYGDDDDRFQREMDYWENRIAANQAKYDQLQNEIDLLEAKGQKADASYYEEQIKLEGQRLGLLNGQKAAAEAHLATLEEGSEEWWSTAEILNGLESDIDDVTESIVDLQDAIGEIDTYKFEELNTRLDNLVSKLGTIRDLIAPDESDWFDDEGQWTEEGVAVLGTYIQELETYKNGLSEAAEELEKYNAAYDGNEAYYESLGIHSEQEYYDKVEELTEQQYDYLSSISDTEQSIVDMYESSIDAVEEYTETLIDGYNDYIDSVKEALDAERDYTL